MMKRSSLFLFELISMILVFSVCAAICVSLMGKAWSISGTSERLTRAVYLAESAAARIQTNEEYRGEAQDGYNVQIEEGGVQDGLVEKTITVSYEEESVYTLTVFCPEGVS